MSIWGFPVMSLHLPWVLMGFHLFTGGNPLNDLIGVAAGHSYVYLTEVLPDSHGYELLKTPNLMKTLVDKLMKQLLKHLFLFYFLDKPRSGSVAAF